METPPRPHRPGLSVRARITITVALLVALALGAAGLIVHAIQAQRIEEANNRAINQELAEFSALQRNGNNADTGRPFASAAEMIRLFLSRNVPDDDELLVGWWDGAPQVRSPSDSITAEPAFREAVAPLVAQGGTTWIEVPDRGEVMITVQAVRSRQQAALVVVTFLDRTRADLRATTRTYVVVSILALMAITGIAAWRSGRLLAPLRRLRRATEEITATDLARRLPETGNDDITALTRTFNGMLDRLEAAFVGQRQFLDDAGHELKTPITVLRGHLELVDPDDPDDVASTRDLLLDEVDRMGRLVGDLILLAKSRRPDFLTRQPTSLERLSHTLLAKARGMADRDWRLDAAASVLIDVDEQRLTQAVLQLVDNAVKHTGDGDTIALGSSYGDHAVRIWVRDTGGGVPESDRAHIFERFGRSVVQAGDEGFGLGLSIVQAIADAHGGSVHVEDPPTAAPSGAMFVITLPRHEEESWPAS